MKDIFSPFTPEVFKKETGLEAADNEAIYFRWLNAQINFANYQNMQEMNGYLKEIVEMLKQGEGVRNR